MMSLYCLQWFGEGEKYVKAVFSLASKIAPSVVFVDEVGLVHPQQLSLSILCYVRTFFCDEGGRGIVIAPRNLPCCLSICLPFPLK